jgi:hypothetical protein
LLSRLVVIAVQLLAGTLRGDVAALSRTERQRYSTRASTGLQLINKSQQASKCRLPVWGGGFSLNGLVKDAIETLDEGGWIFEWDAFKKEGLVEE